MNIPEERLAVLERIHQDWWLYIVLGICLIILGVACITLPLIAALAINALLGVALVIGSIFMAVYAFKMHGTVRKLTGTLIAVLYLVFGLLLLLHPVAGILMLTLFLAAFFLIEGGFKIVGAVEYRGMPNWGWYLAGGILSLILGVLIWVGWPVSTVWAMGLLLGIDLLFSGWTMIMLGFALHSFAGVGGQRLVGEH